MIPPVVASERGTAQTVDVARRQRGCRIYVTKNFFPMLNLPSEDVSGLSTRYFQQMLREFDQTHSHLSLIHISRQTDVLGVEVVDQPGNLNSLLKTLLETNIDSDYIYLSFNRESGCPIMVFHVPDVYETEASLKSKGYTVLESLSLIHIYTGHPL